MNTGRIHRWALLATIVLVMNGADGHAQSADSVYDLDLEALSRTRFRTGATLTRTETERVPASVTTITRRMIEDSGARRLDELLEFYVPNYHWIRQSTAGPVFGFRGIISDQNQKALLLVNGRVVNTRTSLGAMAERFIPALGDIESIQVIRGPGSAVYGPGAISGVISIRTTSPDAFNGLEATVRRGSIESFTLGEVRFGTSLINGIDLLGYFGADKYEGAKAPDSPIVFSKTHRYFDAGVPVDSGIVNDARALDGEPHYKAHLHLKRGGTQLSGRFVRGSTHFVSPRAVIENRGGFEGNEGAILYEQRSVQAEQEAELGERLGIRLQVGYDQTAMARQDPAGPADFEFATSYREYELFLKSLMTYDAGGQVTAAVGVEYARGWFGDDASGITGEPPPTVLPEWETNTYSLLGEIQWLLHPRLSVFLGGRADTHPFTEWMWSPRAAAVYDVGRGHTTKLFFTRSVRKADDLPLKRLNDADPNGRGETETITSWEWRHEFRHNDIVAAVAPFYYDHHIFAWAARLSRTAPVGRAKVAGLETEFRYRSSFGEITLSHGYTKLRDFDLTDEGTIQTITSAPHGYGNDFHSWPRHLGKVAWRRHISRDLVVTGGVRLFWGYQGAEAFTAYNNEVAKRNFHSRSDGRTTAFEGSTFVDMGVNYTPSPRVSVGVNLHGLLGWLDTDANKRVYFARVAGYRSEAAAVSFRLKYSM